MEYLFFFFLAPVVAFCFSFCYRRCHCWQPQSNDRFFFKGRRGTFFFSSSPSPPLPLSDMLVLMPTSDALVVKCFFSVFPLIPLSIVEGFFFFFFFAPPLFFLLREK